MYLQIEENILQMPRKNYLNSGKMDQFSRERQLTKTFMNLDTSTVICWSLKRYNNLLKCA